MASDKLIEKAMGLVVDGHVQVTFVSTTGVVLAGLVRGASGAVYEPTVDPAGEWCDCTYGQMNRGRQCSHTLALQVAARWHGLTAAAPAASVASPHSQVGETGKENGWQEN